MEGLGRNLRLGQDPHERDALRRFKCMTRQDVREKIPNNAATLPSQLIQEIPQTTGISIRFPARPQTSAQTKERRRNKDTYHKH